MHAIKLKFTTSLLLVAGLLFSMTGLAQERAFDVPAMSAASSLPEFPVRPDCRSSHPAKVLQISRLLRSRARWMHVKP